MGVVHVDARCTEKCMGGRVGVDMGKKSVPGGMGYAVLRVARHVRVHVGVWDGDPMFAGIARAVGGTDAAEPK